MGRSSIKGTILTLFTKHTLKSWNLQMINVWQLKFHAIKLLLQAVTRQELECPICLGALVLPDQLGNGPPSSYTTQDLHHAMSSLSKQPVRPNSSQKTRGQGKDSVISKISPQNNSPAEASCCGKTGIRKTVLLSCSHVFHDTCLATFEELTCEERPVCPVCRSLYQKRVLSL